MILLFIKGGACFLQPLLTLAGCWTAVNFFLKTEKTFNRWFTLQVFDVIFYWRRGTVGEERYRIAYIFIQNLGQSHFYNTNEVNG